jgi:hypothetical protein
MSLFFGPPTVGVSFRAEDVVAKLRPDWTLAQAQEEIDHLNGILHAKLTEVGLQLIDAMIFPAGKPESVAPSLCPDCIAELALPEPVPRSLAKELRSAKRILARGAHGRVVPMAVNPRTLQRWLDGCFMNPDEAPLYFVADTYAASADAGFGLTLRDLGEAVPVSDRQWRLRDGRELHVLQTAEVVTYRIMAGESMQALRRIA